MTKKVPCAACGTPVAYKTAITFTTKMNVIYRLCVPCGRELAECIGKQLPEPTGSFSDAGDGI